MATLSSLSFASASVAGYTVKTTPTTSVLSTGTDTLVSSNIESNTDTIEDKKIIMGMDVKVAFSDVNAVLKLQASHNGTDWADVSTLSSDTTPNVTGVKTFVVDLTNVFAPYFRIIFNDTGLAVGTSGTAEFFFAYK